MEPTSSQDGARRKTASEVFRACLTYLSLCVSVFLCLAIVSVYSTYHFMEAPPFDLQRMEQLEVGMTKDEVRKILGEPHSDFDNYWAWSTGWPIVYVYFDKNDRFRAWEYDR